MILHIITGITRGISHRRSALLCIPLVACGPFDTVPPDPARADASSTPDTFDPSDVDRPTDDTTDAELWRPRTDLPLHTADAPGSAWYNYDGRTHAVTPRDLTWIALPNDADAPAHAWALRITSYYDTRGRSGRFSGQTRRWSDGAWTDAGSFAFDDDVKLTPVCVRLEDAQTVACTADWDIAFLTEPRVLPTAGFTVRNPALWFRGHHTQPQRSLRVYAVPEPLTSLPTPDTLLGRSPLPSARLDPTQTPVHDVLEASRNGHEVQHATTDFFFARWTVVDDGDELVFSRACAPLAQTPGAQTTPQPLPPVRVSVPEGTQLHLDLCGEDAPQTTDPRPPNAAALPPTTPEWDLLIERIDDTFFLRTVPGSTARMRPTGAPTDPELWDDV